MTQHASGLLKAAGLRASDEHRASHHPTRLAAPTAASASSLEAVKYDEAAHAKQVAAELARLKERAIAEGLEQGRRQAQHEAQQSAEDAVAAQLRRFTNLAASLQDAWQRDRQQAEDLLADVAFAAISRLLQQAGPSREATLNAVRGALDECGSWKAVTIEVHPDDVEPVQAAFASGSAQAQAPVQIVPSTAVALGGCRVSGSEGTLDARLETQLFLLRDSFDTAREQWRSRS